MLVNAVAPQVPLVVAELKDDIALVVDENKEMMELSAVED
jgi:hypothetical protein